jgi:hypothetical protein
MRTSRPAGIILFILLPLTAMVTRAQTSASEKEVWPQVIASFELTPKTRLQVYGQRQNGEEFGYLQNKFGAMMNFSMRRLIKLPHEEIDKENEYTVVIGAGYEYLQTNQNGDAKRENRLVLQGTAHLLPALRVLLTNRNRVEFRWNNGTYDFRYRNKTVINRNLKLNGFRFTPYISGELFWDRNHHSWNENQYSFGVQFPYKKILMLDTYYLHQNCTTCTQPHVDVLGLTLNLYLLRKKK